MARMYIFCQIKINGAHTNFVSTNKINCKTTQEIPNTNFSPSRSYAQAVSNHEPNLHNLNNESSVLTNILNEFKALINPLLSLFTTVFDRLIIQNVK